MADPNMNKTPEDMKKNETMQREQGQQGGFDKNRQSEKGGVDKEREEKSAIGGGQSGNQPTSQTGEPGRARSELDENKSRSEQTNR